MTAPNYPEWAGRLSEHLDSVLPHCAPGIPKDLAAEALAEYRQTTAAARMFSALGDHRERAVPCIFCRRDTWTIEPVCDRCREAAADVRATGEAS